MIDKDPSTYSALTYAWVIGLSTWAGIVSFLRKMRAGEVKIFNITQFIGEIVTSGFVGVMTFFLCEYAGFSQLLTAALVGISGHMGSRAIMLMESLAEQKINKSL